MPGIALRILNIKSTLFLSIISVWGKYYYYASLRDEEIET